MSAGGPERLVYMANQIAGFFATQPGDDKAARAADHMVAFWDPRMRRLIVEHLRAGGLGLTPAASEAVRLMAATAPAALEAAVAASGHISPGHTPGDDAG